MNDIKQKQVQLLQNKKECLLKAKAHNEELLQAYLQQEKQLAHEQSQLDRQKHKLDKFDDEIRKERNYRMRASTFIGGAFCAIQVIVTPNLEELLANTVGGVLAIIGTEVLCYGAATLAQRYQLSSYGDLEEFDLHRYNTFEQSKGVQVGSELLFDRQEQLSNSILVFEDSQKEAKASYQKRKDK